MIEYEWNKTFCRAYTEGLRPAVKFDHRPIARKISKYLDNISNQIVVDIATGPGYLLFELAEFLESPILIAQDAHIEMLEIAEEEAEKRGEQIQRCQCPAEALDLEDNYADIVVCKQLLHEARDPNKVVSEICRVIKPKGKVFIIDFDADGSKIAARFIKGFMRILSGKQISDNFWKSFCSGLKGSSVVALMKKHGLEGIEYHKRGPSYFLVGHK